MKPEFDAVLRRVSAGADPETAVLAENLEPRAFFTSLSKRQATELRGAEAEADLADLAIIAEAANTRADAAAGTWQAARARIDMRKQASAERELAEINRIALG